MRRWALLLLLLALPARGEDLHLDLGGQPLPPLAELVLRGENRDPMPRLLVLRVDDRASPTYTDRVNAERLVQPGPFTLRLRLALQATPRGRALELGALRQAIAHVPQGMVVLASLALEAPPALPEGVRGWSFAAPGAAPLAGFEPVAADDPRVSGPAPRLVRRPGDEPLLGRGMARVTRFAAPLPPGRWQVTLFTEDPGEWETLPPVLEHRIRVNGQDFLYVRRSAEDWVRDRYLAGRDREARLDETPYAALGAHRGGRVQGVVQVGEAGLVVELAGHPHAATYLAAVLAEPVAAGVGETTPRGGEAAAPGRGVAALEALRAARFAEDWPVLATPPRSAPPALTLAGPAPTPAAPGGVAVLRFSASGPAAMPLGTQMTWQGGALPAQLLWGQWRWRRPAPETPGLVLAASPLRADLAGLSLPEGLPREFTVLVRVPADAAPGRRRLALTVVAPGGARASATAELTVLAVARPAPRARIGVWLDHAPQWLVLPGMAALAERQAACDLATLAGLGLTAVAPPLATPGDAAGQRQFVQDLAAAAGPFRAPLLAYAPLRRLRDSLGAREAAQAVLVTEAAATRAGLPLPVWTLADEPTGGGTAEAARALALALREAGSQAALAGHLNDPADAALLPLLALATVNWRYGADAADIAAVRAAGPAPWLYNMPRQRLSGGFYLWRSGADGLLQWHARMPTADAYDPTDGREGDVQFLWPPAAPCAPPDLDADLLEMVEAGEDLRWLAWLEAEAPRRPAAASLLARLQREVPDRWASAAALPRDASAGWRAAIAALAK